MATGAAIGERLDRTAIQVMVLSFVGMVVDGYDLTVAGYAAPALRREWHIDPDSIGLILSLSLVGVFVGSPLFGWLGDMRGRKTALIWSNVVLGLATFATAYAYDVTSLAALRFAAGIGIGGVIPNLVALVSEFAPRSRRSRNVLLVSLGSSIGAALPGVVALYLERRFGWPIFFFLGGFAPLIIAVLFTVWLPESPAFQREQAHATDVPGRSGHFHLAPQLFRRDFALITPLLWSIYAADLLVYYFIFGWTPLLLNLAHVDAGTTAHAMILFAVGGALSGLALGPVIDRHGLRAIIVLFVLSALFAASIGAWPHTSFLLFATFGAGFCLLGLQYSLNAITGSLYPAAFRSLGVGSALGIGRIGAIAGSLGGGALLAAKFPIDLIYALAIGPLALAAGAATVIHIITGARKTLGADKTRERIS